MTHTDAFIDPGNVVVARIKRPVGELLPTIKQWVGRLGSLFLMGRSIGNFIRYLRVT
jgi:hypothetical protein